MMNVDIKTLAYMYGVTDMYTQLRIMQEDGKPSLRRLARSGTSWKRTPIVRWLDGRIPWKTVKHLFHW